MGKVLVCSGPLVCISAKTHGIGECERRGVVHGGGGGRGMVLRRERKRESGWEGDVE